MLKVVNGRLASRERHAQHLSQKEATMFVHLKRWLGPGRRRMRPVATRRPYRPEVEVLETRFVPSTVSGEAFGAFANLTAPNALSVPKTPDVVLPPNGGMQEARLLSLSQPGVIS